jgi:hypothetical protein
MNVLRDTCIADALEEIRSGCYAEKIGKVRTLVAKHGKDSDLVKAAKLELPAYLFSGRISGKVAQAMIEGRFHHSGLLQLDFDGIADPEVMRDELIQDPHVIAAWLSPSGQGVKGLLAIEPAATEAEHKAAFEAAESYFNTRGLILDKQCKNTNRLCFAGWDGELRTRVDAEPLSLSVAPLMAKAAAPILRTEKRETLDVETVREMLAAIPPKPPYDQWLRIASGVWDALGETEGTALLKEWSPELKTGEYDRKLKHRLMDVHAGTLVHFAKQHGWRRRSQTRSETATPLNAAREGCSNADGEQTPAHDDKKEVAAGDHDWSIPDDVFPVPAGGISYTRAAEAIFPVIATYRTLFMRGGTSHELINPDGDIIYLRPVRGERFCAMIENFGRRIARRELIKDKVTGEERLVWRSVTLPKSSAEILLETDAARDHLPPIVRLSGCEILDSSGNLLRSGYHDHGGGTFITGNNDVATVPLKTAITALLDLLADFNFTTRADKSRAAASLISPALKAGQHILDDFPLDVAEADQSQSGKTFRQKLVAVLYGEVPTAITAPKSGVGGIDEAISTALIKGRPFITLDNFRGRLDSTILEEAIRGSGRVMCRALRVSAEVDCRPFNWQLSTNGAELTRDMANRSIITRIRKQPEGYIFKRFREGDLLAHVAACRGFYLGCIFTVIREWIAAGRPRTAESRHDFREWVRVMDWIGQELFQLPPLLDGHREEQQRTANPALQWLRDVCHATVGARAADRELSTSELVSIADDVGIEFPGNPASREEPVQRAGKILGRLFRETDGKPVSVDGFSVSRKVSHTYENGMRDVKFYTVTPASSPPVTPVTLVGGKDVENLHTSEKV